ncbi:MAG: hypothetical protein ABI903_07390 [Actinomycetota bacterium]
MAAAEAQDDNVAEGVDLTDGDIASEMELVSRLVVAATSSERPLRQDEVDELLGVTPKKDGTGLVSEA